MESAERWLWLAPEQGVVISVEHSYNSYSCRSCVLLPRIEVCTLHAHVISLHIGEGEPFGRRKTRRLIWITATSLTPTNFSANTNKTDSPAHIFIRFHFPAHSSNYENRVGREAGGRGPDVLLNKVSLLEIVHRHPSADPSTLTSHRTTEVHDREALFARKASCWVARVVSMLRLRLLARAYKVAGSFTSPCRRPYASPARPSIGQAPRLLPHLLAPRVTLLAAPRGRAS
jgi:hypothetical protein